MINNLPFDIFSIEADLFLFELIINEFLVLKF